MTKILDDRRYMARAVQLARCGEGFTSPNPMVGCVIVAPDGRIVGEGCHRVYGGPHAEVNAVRSVAEEDRPLLPQCTLYVTLEPCSHYGKTPPCAKMVAETGFARVVVGAGDPNPKVSGRGIQMIRDAGIPVQTGLMAWECEALNPRFMTAHRLHRPFVQLKWACTADGFVSHPDGTPLAVSNPVSLGFMHQQRALADAIMVGTDSANTDNPRLDVRLREARRNPLRITFNRHGRLRQDLQMLEDNCLVITEEEPLAETLKRLYAMGVTSLMVEGGPSLQRSFIEERLWDEIRVERSPQVLGNGIPAPQLPETILGERVMLQGNSVEYHYPPSARQPIS